MSNMGEEERSDPVRLDGRKLEGGGQLVRIAVALSALTGKAVIIDHVRGNRSGKRGLKASHLAAIKVLGELSGSTLVNAQVGSCSVGFYPPPQEQVRARQTSSDINIRLPTPGSVFLVFQALYPYLLYSYSADQVRLSIVGGTNVSSSPSYDYVSQVLIPNFARVGLPPISVRLEKRGWASCQGHLGKVVFVIDTLRRRRGGASSHGDLSIDLHRCRRGKISKIDITVLAPDDHLVTDTAGTTESGSSKRGFWGDAAAQLGENKKPETVREFMERHVHAILRRRLEGLPRDVFVRSPFESAGLERRPHVIPIETHTTEATHRRSCLYVLIVAHTSTGFKIGRDALHGSIGEQPRTKRRQNKQEDLRERVERLVDNCVERLIRELYDPLPQSQPSTPEPPRHRPCVDEFMRDQLVIFEALGRASNDEDHRECESLEDEKYWSLHTKTAQWVCRELLGQSSIR
ncbi:RNA 3'-terminal phosphate cyclase/enolpyruvate transferase [Aspergillus spinulosporus]